MIKTVLPILILILSQAALAAGDAHGGHGGEGVPVQKIMYQAMNFGIIVVGLIYFLKAKVRTFFVEKRAAYVAASEKTKTARQAAEQEKMQIQVRLTKLQSTAEESVARARAEAADMKKTILEEARASSERIRKEAESMARLEIEKAKVHLREKLIEDAVKQARALIAEKVSADDHQRLQNDFISNIQAVR